MIPVCAKERIEYTDEDGVVWTFLPKTGRRERALVELGDKAQTMTPAEAMDSTAIFIDEILVKWNGKGLPDPGVAKLSAFLNSAERWRVIEMWGKANELPPEEKKS